MNGSMNDSPLSHASSLIVKTEPSAPNVPAIDNGAYSMDAQTSTAMVYWKYLNDWIHYSEVTFVLRQVTGIK